MTYWTAGETCLSMRDSNAYATAIMAVMIAGGMKAPRFVALRAPGMTVLHEYKNPGGRLFAAIGTPPLNKEWSTLAKTVKIRNAFPHVLDRKYPVVKPEYPLLTVLYLLRMNDVAAVPLVGGAGGPRALFGFSSLARLLALPPGGFAAFLAEPCGNVADKLESVGVDDDLESLLEAFKARRLGVACVRGGGPEKRSLVTLGDVIELYSKDRLRARSTLEEVASPVISARGETSIRKGIEEMFSRRIRRLFLSDDEYVSDRSIMDRVFSPLVLDDVAADPTADVLAAPLNSLKKGAPIRVRRGTSIKAAAAKLRGEGLQCLVVGDAVVTQWDLVMKPWLSGNVSIR